MRAEIAEIPEAAARLLESSAGDIAFIGTIARGSSDHAASFLKYAIELTAGVPVASLSPSIASIYNAPLRFNRGATISISQSGESPDILAMTKEATAGGAETIALVNKPESPLAKAVSHPVNITAGPELSVAATKSFFSSIAAGLAILAEWQEDAALRAALARLPEDAEKSLACDWSALTEALDQEESLYVLGRGPAMAIASEAALKFKETSGLHAEAYSSAEVMHGPIAIVDAGFPVLAFAARDAAGDTTCQAADDLTGSGANVFVTCAKPGKAQRLPRAASGHAFTDALCLVLPLYVFVESYARHRGLDPDRPPRLRKVTATR
jgi:glucosamine--fructose-6-phosphate aminotransferase (isomerizing)